MKSSDEAAVYNQEGCLKVVVHTAEGLAATENPVFARVSLGENEGSTHTGQKQGDQVTWQASFQFPYEGEHVCVLEVVDSKTQTVICSKDISLADVLKSNEWQGAVSLEPQGSIVASLYFVAAPKEYPKKLTVQIQNGRDIIGNHHNYLVAVCLGDEEDKWPKTDLAKSGIGKPSWKQRFDLDYANEQQVAFELYSRGGAGTDELLGTCAYDLWGARKNGNNTIAGELPLVTATTGLVGYLSIGLVFWDPDRDQPPSDKDFPEKNTAPVPAPEIKALETPAEPAPPIASPPVAKQAELPPPAVKLNSSSSSSTSSSSTSDKNSNSSAEAKVGPMLDRLANALAAARQSQDRAPFAPPVAEAVKDIVKLSDDLGDSKDPNKVGIAVDKAEATATKAAKHATIDNAARANRSAAAASEAAEKAIGLASSHPGAYKAQKLAETAAKAARAAARSAQRAARAGRKANQEKTLRGAKQLEDEVVDARCLADERMVDAQNALQALQDLLNDTHRDLDAKKGKLEQAAEDARLAREEAEADRRRTSQRNEAIKLRHRPINVTGDVYDARAAEGMIAFPYHGTYGNVLDPHGVNPAYAGKLCCGAPPQSKSSDRIYKPGASWEREENVRGGSLSRALMCGPQAPQGRRMEPMDAHDMHDPTASIGGEFLPEARALRNTNGPACWCCGCGLLKCCGEC